MCRLKPALSAFALMGTFLGSPGPAVADQTVTISEGTRMALSVSPDGQWLAISLMGRVWLLPAQGGQARRFSPPGVHASRPSFSPAGDAIAFQAGTQPPHSIWLAPFPDGPARQATFGDFDDRDPAWDPGTGKLSFSSDRTGDYGIWLLDPESLDLQPLTFDSGDETSPAWTADGTRLAYLSSSGGRQRIVTRPPRRPWTQVIETGNRLDAPSWRPDGSVLAFIERDRDRQRLQMAIMSDPAVIKNMAPGEEPYAAATSWLDRNRFYYVANGQIRYRLFGQRGFQVRNFTAQLQVPVLDLSEPLVYRWPMGLSGFDVFRDGRLAISAQNDLWIVESDGQGIQRLTDNSDSETDPAVSPDGFRLAYVSQGAESAGIRIMDLSTGQSLTVPGTQGAHGPAWHPEGTALVAARSDPGQLLLMDTKNDHALQALTGFRKPRQPVWSQDGSHILVSDLAPRAAALSAQRALWRLSLDPKTRLPVQLDLLEGLEGVHSGAGLQTHPEGLVLSLDYRVKRLPIKPDGMPAETLSATTGDIGTHPRWHPDTDEIWALGPGGLLVIGPDAEHAEVRELELPEKVLPKRPTRQIIRVRRLFDGLGNLYTQSQEIVLSDDRIAELRPWRAPESGSLVWDFRKLTAIPGLIDSHVHQGPSVSAQIGARWLAWGITTIREITDDPARSSDRGRIWDSKILPGPRLIMDMAASAGDADLCHRCWINQAGLPQAKAGTRLAATLSPGTLGGTAQLLENLLGADLHGGVAIHSGLGQVYSDISQVMAVQGASLVPTLAANQSSSPVGPALSRGTRRALSRLTGAGVRLAIGSDSPLLPYGSGLHQELEVMTRAGLRPFQALRMATADGARALGVQSDRGALRAGLYADLVIVEGDPLERIQDASRVVAVVRGGQVFSKRKLLSMIPGESSD